MPRPTPELQREYGREWIAKRRRDWLEANGPCARCGSWNQLEIDHIDPATKITHNVWSWSEARRLAELAKCQVLCKQCHDQKTEAEDGYIRTIRHGSTTRYDKGCRCAPCTAANTARARRKRANKKARGQTA